MINYIIRYYKIFPSNYVDEGRFVLSSEQERAEYIEHLRYEGYTITEVFEDEDCYCEAYYEGECACGNYK